MSGVLVVRNPSPVKGGLMFMGTGLGLLGLSGALVHGAGVGDFAVAGKNWQAMGATALVWLAVCALQRLPVCCRAATLRQGLTLLFKTNLTVLLVVSLLVNGLQLIHWSRFMVYGTIACFGALQSVALAVYRCIVPAGPVEEGPGGWSRAGDVSFPLAALDLLILIVSSLAVTFVKCGEVAGCSSHYEDILVLGAGIWAGSAMVSQKFSRSNFANHHMAVATAIKSLALFSGLLAFCLFAMRLGPVSRVLFFGTLGLYLALELVLFYSFVRYRKMAGRRDIDDVRDVQAFLQSQQRELPPVVCEPVNDPVQPKLRNALDFLFPALNSFLQRHIDLAGIDRCRCALMSSKELFNLEAIEQGRMGLIVNLHKLNDFRWFNRYFLLAHTRLRPGGFLVGMAHTVDTQRNLYADRFPRPLDGIFYGMSFLWRRVCPKLPWLKKVYFLMTKGENRIVSRAEVLGRLHFCGFRVVAETEMDHRFFFIARKAKTPSTNRQPSLGPLIGLRRHGLGGQAITVYKLRTMFPYSEYLQDYVYRHNALADGGKFKNDFRVTGWGRVLRSLWIDELPMLYNWLRGDLQLVGVRPLSNQYLALYDPEMQALRRQVKPGLLPPFYADMPKTLAEIQESERRYIKAYLKKPGMTQCGYFLRCFWNIAVLQKRSA